MDNNEKTSEKITKWLLVGISVLFLAVMLLLPLITVITEALRSGWKVYAAAVTDEYTIKALLLTVKATLFAVIFNTVFGVFAAWALTKFQFRGKKLLTTLIDLPVTISPVIAGLIFLLIFGRQSPVYFFLMKLGIKVVFSVPGIIIATVFVTFPFISRELIPVLEAEGSDEEETAALMGAGGWTIFWLSMETIHLIGEEDMEAIYLAKLGAKSSVGLHSAVGKRIPLHCTGGGKAILAWKSESWLENYLAHVKRERFTGKTLTDAEDLRRELEVIRIQGYAVDNHEHHTDVVCIAAPVFDVDNQVLAAIGIAAPDYRFSLEKALSYSGEILRCAARITEKLGWHYPIRVSKKRDEGGRFA